MTRTLPIEGAHGVLWARLDLPADEAPDAFALVVQDFTCPPDPEGLCRVSDALGRAGFGALRVDAWGRDGDGGPVDGELAPVGVPDVRAAANYLERHHEAPALLVGHSLGGAAVLAAASELPSVRAVATIGAPAGAEEVERLLATAGADGATAGAESAAALLAELRAEDLSERVARLRKPLLILHAPFDDVVGIDAARRLFLAARHPKSFVSLDGADHELSDGADADFAGTVVASWAARYVERPRRAPWKGDPKDNRIAARTERGLRTEIAADGFAMVADEPVAVGGSGAGPTPYDLLAAALGACTTMTLRMYADRKGWPLRAAQARVRHAKVHAEDSVRDGDGAPRRARIDHFDREVRLEGPLDEAQRARLLEIANRCPVHRTLGEGPVTVSTRLAPADEELAPRS